MTINYQDTGLNVTYLQVFLKEYFGLSVDTKNNLSIFKDPEYYITSGNSIRVTGSHNPQTYTSIALYMFYNYPEEKYPYYWYDKSWSGVEVSGHLSQYPAPGDIDGFLDIIKENLRVLPDNKSAIEIPVRVLSYVLGEVVSSSSDYEEILRVKKLINPLTSFNNVTDSLEYDDSLTEEVKSIQQKFIDKYTVDDNGNKVVNLPSGFEDFKVTGYVDPWTEVVIKDGVE